MRNVVITLVLAGMLACAIAAQAEEPAAVLQSNAPDKDKMEACRTLQRTGEAADVPALAALLGNETLSHWARYALQSMPCSEAGAALLEALPKTDGIIQAGIANSLALRGDVQAVPALIPLLSSDNPDAAQAAARGLGHLGTPEAAAALLEAAAKADAAPTMMVAVCDGLFMAAEKAPEQALTIYDALLETANAPAPAKDAALRGAVLTRGAEGLPILLKALHDDNSDIFNAALRAARELPKDDAISGALAKEIAALPAARKIRLMQVLGERGGSAAAPAMLAEMQEGPVEVRVAALRALTRIAYAPAIAPIGELLRAEDEALAQAARDAIAYFPGEAGDEAIEAMLTADKPEARLLAIELIGKGALAAPVAILMQTAEKDADENIRLTALKALRNYANAGQMPGLLALLLAERSPAEMEAAESALKAVCSREQKAAGGEIKVEKAVYGVLPGGPSKDVTDKAGKLVGKGATAIEACNANFGDPASGKKKQMTITYTVDGAQFTKTVNEGQKAELTVAVVPAPIVDAFCTAFATAKGEAKLALLRLLGNTASPKAFAAIRDAAENGNDAIKTDALRELCGWPTADALPLIMDLAASDDETVRVLAVRGAVRLLKQSKSGSDDVLKQYAALMNNARNAEEKKLVLSGLAQVPGPGAFAIALRQLGDEAVKAEALQTAIVAGQNLGLDAREDDSISTKSLDGWKGTEGLWRIQDGAVVGGSEEPLTRNEFLWAAPEVRDFYLALDVKLEPNEANGGIQLRSKAIDEHGQAQGCQADMGKDVWGRLYHEHGRGKLFWDGRAEAAVKPGEWNRYEILAIGPAIWTAINGTLGVALLDGPEYEPSGQLAVQVHAGKTMTASYRLRKLIHNPKLEIAGQSPEQLIGALRPPDDAK